MTDTDLRRIRALNDQHRKRVERARSMHGALTPGAEWAEPLGESVASVDALLEEMERLKAVQAPVGSS